MKKIFNFWQDHSERFLILAYLHEHDKEMIDADATATKTGDCGDSVTFYLSFANNCIKSLTYQLKGCIHTNACCNAIAEMAEGETVERCWQIQPEDIIKDLQTLPADHYHCAELTVGTFYLALSQYSQTIS